MQKSLLSALLLHGLQGGCHGFVSNNAKASLRPRTTRSTTYSLPKEKITSDPIIVDQELVFDVAEEQVDSIFSEASDEPSGLFGNCDTVPVGLIEDLSESSSVSRDEDVQAILVASGEAAAEAEASMPPELIQQLAFTNTNTTIETIPDILKAASVVGEPATRTKMQPPTVSKILKFAIPAIGVWLCGPLLSMIDTSAVGLFSGTVQQAALSPAVAVTDYAALLIVS
jgi:hypothetical protein